MLKNLLGLILAGAMLGCITSGRQFDTTAIERIEVGKTTESEVLALVGAPLEKARAGNGIDLYNYTYVEQAPLGLETEVATLQVQLFNGVVINKYWNLGQY